MPAERSNLPTSDMASSSIVPTGQSSVAAATVPPSSSLSVLSSGKRARSGAAPLAGFDASLARPHKLRRFGTPDSAMSAVTEEDDLQHQAVEEKVGASAEPLRSLFSFGPAFCAHGFPGAEAEAEAAVAMDGHDEPTQGSLDTVSEPVDSDDAVLERASCDGVPEPEDYDAAPEPAMCAGVQDPAQCDSVADSELANCFATGDTGAINWTHDLLVEVLSSDIEDLCAVNDGPDDATDGDAMPDALKIFYSVHRQPFEVEFYVRRLVSYSNCSASAFVTMLVYLDRVQEKCKELSMTEMNCHRLLSTALVLAIKYLDDEVYSNAYYARVGGLSTSELNNLETTMLGILDWNLTVSPDTYNLYEDSLMQSATLHQHGGAGVEPGSPASEFDE